MIPCYYVILFDLNTFFEKNWNKTQDELKKKEDIDYTCPQKKIWHGDLRKY